MPWDWESCLDMLAWSIRMPLVQKESWFFRGLNTVPSGLQSDALPDELKNPGQDTHVNKMLTALCQILKDIHSSKMSPVECVGHPDLTGLHARNTQLGLSCRDSIVVSIPRCGPAPRRRQFNSASRHFLINILLFPLLLPSLHSLAVHDSFHLAWPSNAPVSQSWPHSSMMHMFDLDVKGRTAQHRGHRDGQ
jgi:hypothetical protein